MSLFFLQAPTGIGQCKCRVNKAFITNHSLFLLWEKLKPGQLHPTFTGNCPWSRVQFRFIIDPPASGFAYAWKARGAGSWGIPVFDPFSFTVYDQVQGDLNFPSNPSNRGLSVWGNPQTTIKPFISGPFPHHAPSCSNQVCKAFPLFRISWINCKIRQPLPVTLVLSGEAPLASLGSTRLLWFLTGVTWKCTVGAH